MSSIIFDEYLKFPADKHTSTCFARLAKLCDCVEDVEQNFRIEFSCGDGKYYNDYWYWTEGGALCANYHKDEEYEEVAKYDGQVCLENVPRFEDGELFKAEKEYRFTIKSKDADYHDDVIFLIDGKERSRKNIL